MEIDEPFEFESGQSFDIESGKTCLTNDSPPSVLPCTVPCEPTVPLSHTLLGIFHLLFTPVLISMIAEQTNVYAREVLSTDAYERFDQVRPLEIQAYFGFVILMEINQLPCLYDYWKFDPT